MGSPKGAAGTRSAAAQARGIWQMHNEFPAMLERSRRWSSIVCPVPEADEMSLSVIQPKKDVDRIDRELSEENCFPP
jgi:hypothetical protein